MIKLIFRRLLFLIMTTTMAFTCVIFAEGMIAEGKKHVKASRFGYETSKRPYQAAGVLGTMTRFFGLNIPIRNQIGAQSESSCETPKPEASFSRILGQKRQ